MIPDRALGGRPEEQAPPLRSLPGGGLRALDDAALVARACAGDRAAKEVLYRRHASMVLGLAHRLLAGRDGADDVAQEAFLKAFCRLKELREPPAFGSWLGSITVRIARSRLRRHRLLCRFGLADAAPLDTERLVSASASPETTAELRALYELLEALPVDARIALVLRRVEGRTVAEVAACMQVSESTAKRHITAGEVLLASRLSRGRQG